MMSQSIEVLLGCSFTTPPLVQIGRGQPMVIHLLMLVEESLRLV